MNTSKLIAKAHIPQNEAVLLKVGDPAELQLVGVELVKGRVMVVSPALDPGSTTIEIWIEVLKPVPALKPGMNVEVAITAKSIDKALVVPASAVYKTPEGDDFLLLAGPDNKAHLAKVKIGLRNKELAEIASGIKENDTVITVGGYALPDGTQIKVEAGPAAAGEKESVGQGVKPGENPGKKPPNSVAPTKAKE